VWSHTTLPSERKPICSSRDFEDGDERRQTDKVNHARATRSSAIRGVEVLGSQSDTLGVGIYVEDENQGSILASLCRGTSNNSCVTVLEIARRKRPHRIVHCPLTVDSRMEQFARTLVLFQTAVPEMD
jgi:hypothetical protein